MNRKSGYSFLEVLIAFAVMTVILASLVPQQLLVLERATGSTQRYLAFDYALSLLNASEVIGDDFFLAIEQNYRDWTVLATMDDVSEASNRLYVIEILDARGKLLAKVTSNATHFE